jgi:hypothetical protein
MARFKRTNVRLNCLPSKMGIAVFIQSS